MISTRKLKLIRDTNNATNLMLDFSYYESLMYKISLRLVRIYTFYIRNLFMNKELY